MRKEVQAKHIADAAILAVIDEIQGKHCRATGVSDLCRALNMPSKVVRAKCAGMIRRGLIDGCACGCSGGFERLPHK